jgi:hypothetical protein
MRDMLMECITVSTVTFVSADNKRLDTIDLNGFEHIAFCCRIALGGYVYCIVYTSLTMDKTSQI